MAAPSLTYTLANDATADADQVMQNFNDLLNGYTDGTKDLSIAALTVASTATFNGSVVIGNASSDDFSLTASLASSIPIKTNNIYDIGSSTLGIRKLYFGNGGAGATCDVVSASHATTREYTIPDCGAAANFVMTQLDQTISGTKTFDGQLIGKGTATNDSAASGYIGEQMSSTVLRADRTSATTGTAKDIASLTLTAGDWIVWGSIGITGASGTTVSQHLGWIGTTATTVAEQSSASFTKSGNGAAIASADDDVTAVPMTTVRVASGTQAVYLGHRTAFAVSTLTSYGSIYARRIG